MFAPLMEILVDFLRYRLWLSRDRCARGSAQPRSGGDAAPEYIEGYQVE